MQTKKTAIVLLAICAICFACGPSLRRTHESDNGFARCFDMDYNPSAQKHHKVACWTTWLDNYVYNQPADKVGYAKLRLDELAQGISIPGPPGREGSFDKRLKPEPEKPLTNETLPSPTQSQLPEPTTTEQPAIDQPVAGQPNVEQPKTEIPPAQPSPKTSMCEQKCKDAHTTCLKSCGAEAGPETECSSKCIEGYTACIKPCLK